MATTKRPKRNARTTAQGTSTPASAAAFERGQALEVGAAPAAVVLEAGGQELNDAPTLTLPVMHNQPAPELVPPPAPATPALQPATDATIIANEPVAAPAASTTSPSLTPSEERATFMRRRMVALAGLLALLLVVGILAYRFMAPQIAATPASPAVPVAQQPAAPVAQQPAAPADADVIGNCSAVPGLPVFGGATCTKQDRDEDNGQIKLDNTYIANAPAADVNTFYEGAFAQNGWTISDTNHDAEDGQWKYSLTQGQRELKVKIEAQKVTQGNITEFTIAED